MKDIFKDSRCRFTRMYLRILGIMPNQSKLESRGLQSIYFLLAFSQFTPQIRRCLLDSDPEVLLTTIPPIMAGFIGVTKLINIVINGHKIRRLLSLIQEYWFTMKEGPEYDMSYEWIDNSQKITIYYTVLIYNVLITFILLPMRDELLVWIGFSEGPAPYQLPYPVDYLVDERKYFFYIESHISICSFIVTTLIVSGDAVLSFFVCHGCGLFSALSVKLNLLNSQSNMKIELYPEKKNDIFYWSLIDCIKKHNRAIEFNNILNSTFSTVELFLVGLSVIIMSFSGFQVAAKLGDMNTLLRYGPFISGQLGHLFIQSAIAQQLINCSIQLEKSIMMVKWYGMSMRSRKLLNLMIMRSRNPSVISAGKTFVMSMEFFATVLRSSMTYFTVLRSQTE